MSGPGRAAAPGRALGVDLGTVRTGVAVSAAGVAQPLAVLTETGEALVRRLAGIARDESATVIVVGNPVRLDGTEAAEAERAKEIAGALRAASGVAVVLWDERLTTAQAERSLVGAGVRRRKRRDVVDKVAAALLLQSYLDAGSPA